MQTKLTLRLDEELIRKAKDHARRSGCSVSQLVAELFSFLGIQAGTRGALTPKVAALKGVLKGSRARVGSYKRYLEDKHR